MSSLSCRRHPKNPLGSTASPLTCQQRSPARAAPTHVNLLSVHTIEAPRPFATQVLAPNLPCEKTKRRRVKGAAKECKPPTRFGSTVFGVRGTIATNPRLEIEKGETPNRMNKTRNEE
ncbi:hypothetical protein L596_029745 [Steinernema carpocapsae]|uniref:Uncharacterized protein n=1 Tax=Steinernema carpocapsae TaxID=34508 RepID=A0A4U5LQQ0_STECR|nr:hypothetical protein L596_029745 [Steinernema carpocapsae]